MVSVRFVGSGGQGVVLASTILAEAANADGMHAAQSQSYSAQVRGDITRGDVIMSDQPIVYPVIDVPDIIVAMDDSALKRYEDEGAMLFYDSSLINRRERGKGIKATGIATEELSSVLYANMVLLGFLVKETGIVNRECVESVLAKHSREQENVKAFHLGLAASEER